MPSFHSKFDTLLHKTQQGAAGTKVARVSKFRSIISLINKIVEQMWHDHTINQGHNVEKRDKLDKI